MLKQVQKLIILLIAWVSLPLFLLTTNPERLPLPLLIVPFLLLLVVLYASVKTLLMISFKDLPVARVKAMSLIFATMPTLLLLLASIRQLTVRDTAIIAGLLALLLFYLRRLDFLANK